MRRLLALSLALTVIGSVIGVYGMYLALNPEKTCSTHTESGVTVYVCSPFPSIVRGFFLICLMMFLFFISAIIEPFKRPIPNLQEDDLE